MSFGVTDKLFGLSLKKFLFKHNKFSPRCPNPRHYEDEDCLQSPDKQAKVHDLKKYIDPLVYKLYNLTPEEIVIVEGKRGMPSVS